MVRRSVATVLVSASMVGVSLLVGCDGSSAAQLFGGGETARLRNRLEPSLGPELAGRVAPLWSPTIEAANELGKALGAEDFVRYHKASLALRDAHRKSVDDTIALLESQADPSWKRKMLAESVAGDATEASDGQADAGDRDSGMFPSGDLETSDEQDRWLQRQMIEQPRLAGEIARAAVDMQVDSGRLGVFLMTQLGGEAINTMGEAAKGFGGGR